MNVVPSIKPRSAQVASIFSDQAVRSRAGRCCLCFSAVRRIGVSDEPRDSLALESSRSDRLQGIEFEIDKVLIWTERIGITS